MLETLKYLKGDRVIWVVSMLLGLLSILAVYSSIVTLAYKYQGGNTEYFLIKHGIMLVTGFLLMFYAHKLKFKYYSRLSQIGIWLAIFLLILTLAVGANINHASRWLVIPVINQNFQTSDFAKIALIAFVARQLSVHRDGLHDFKLVATKILLPIGAVCLLIFPANFSTAALLFFTCFVLLFIGRVPLKYLGATLGGIVLLVSILLLIAKGSPDTLPRLATWQKRITSFEAGGAEANYQAEHAKIAIATGGLTGKGPSKGSSRNYLPHPYSDMIYAFIIEEYGSLIGGVGVLLLYLILLFRSVKVSVKCPSHFGSYLAIGLSLSLVFQAMINMGVAVGLLPVTGQPLPLVSMGGTSIWFTCITIGIILSVSRSIVDEEEVETKKGGQYATA